MKIISYKYIGEEEVFDLSMQHLDHSFVHECGIVMHNSAVAIIDQEINGLIPLTTQKEGKEAKVVTQYTMSGVEQVGALKFDFLGLSTLKDIQGAIKLIQERNSNIMPKGDHLFLNNLKVPMMRILPYKGELYDIWDLPYVKEVYDDIGEGRTETVFQLNTPTAQKWLREFNYKKPNKDERLINSIDEIAYFTALDRPGPLDAPVECEDGKTRNMLEEYARRARGAVNTLAQPILMQLMPETYGICVTQEQLQNLYQNLTGCTGIQANEFRDKIGKKKMTEVLATKPYFIENASKKISPEDAEAIWQQIVTFGQYGFNFSHSVAYSYVAYACAFLKHVYPLEWWCSILNNADKTKIFEQFWPFIGHLVKMPDINKSKYDFVIDGDKIVAPLSFIKKIGEKAHDQLRMWDSYKDVNEFCEKMEKIRQNGRLAVNLGHVSSLILTGAMDPLFESGLTFYEKLDAYSIAQAKARGEKKVKSIDSWSGLSPLNLYQIKKEVLPIATEDLLGKLPGLGMNEIVSSDICYNSGRIEKQYSYIVKRHNGEDLEFYFVDANKYKQIDADPKYPLPARVAMIGYVMAERVFSWDKPESKGQGINLTFEANGSIFEFVKWGNRKTGKLGDILMNAKNQTLTGALVILLLQKWSPDKKFTADGIVLVSPSREIKDD